MKLGVTANPRKPAALEIASRVIAQIGSRADVVVSDEAPSVGPTLPHQPLEEMRPDVLVAIGGDGTFLYTLGRNPTPLLPINAGTVGVLAEIGAHRAGEFEAAIERLLSGFYHLEERMKLAAEIDHTPLPDATNDVVLHSSRVGRMAQFEVSVDGEVAGVLRSDGIIVASPTGSTAYSLSSLGPIVDPGLDALVLTSIAPFRAEARAIVIEPLRTIRLRVTDPHRDAVVIVDGQADVPVPAGAALTIYRSPRRARIVRFGSSFLYRLRGKSILPWTEEAEGGAGAHADLPPPA
ncbi:MAG: NAD(+)/NADH kinase [Thermoplasmata archaeon]